MTLRDAKRLCRAVLSATDRLGLVKEYADPNRTLCDYDAPARPPGVTEVLALSRTIGVKPEWMRYDKTEHGWHLVVHWGERLTPWQTLALQAILGSDKRREALNWFRLFNSRRPSRHWNILYEYKVYRQVPRTRVLHLRRSL